MSARRQKPTTEVEPPWSEEAESWVIAAMLREPECIPNVCRHVGVEHFHSHRHQLLFSVLIDLFSAGTPIDCVAVGEALARREQLHTIGGGIVISRLYESILTAAGVSHKARIVRRDAYLRSVQRAAVEMLRLTKSKHADPEDVIQTANAILGEVAGKTVEKTAEPVRRIASRVLSELSERMASPTKTVGIPTGFSKLDELTGGLCPGNMVVVAGRPGMGKSALGFQLAEVAAQHTETLFFSLEMGEDELVTRSLSGRSDTALFRIRQGYCQPDEIARLANAACDLPERLGIVDCPAWKVSNIATECRRKEMQGGLGLIVVDYLQLIRATDRRLPREQQVSEISNSLKRIAREQKICVIALAQLNRSSESRTGNVPKMADLRESGTIEQDADIVLLLHRPEVYEPTDRPGEADVIIAKSRNGATGTVELSFVKHVTRFEDKNEWREMPPMQGEADWQHQRKDLA